MRHITQASYRSTELGQLQQTLNALMSKKKRRSDKLETVKNKIKILKDKATDMDGQLSAPDKTKINRLQIEFKHAQADFFSLEEEIKNLKALQAEKREHKKKKSEEIFNTDDAEMDANAYLDNVCGLAGGEEPATENVLAFTDM